MTLDSHNRFYGGYVYGLALGALQHQKMENSICNYDIRNLPVSPVLAATFNY